MIDKIWLTTEYDHSLVAQLSKELGVSEILAKLLIKRGYKSIDASTSFLNKDFSLFHSPFLLNDVEKGANVVIDAINKKEKILIWGDYDVDGVTSVVVLMKYLTSIGGVCEYYIPKRDDDGYGLNSTVLDNYVKSGTRLVITVDSGITAVDEIKRLTDSGVRVIVTDHHECQETLPCADAIINPKRHDCNYPFTDLAGVGVVFKFICGIEMILKKFAKSQALSNILPLYSEFVAIGTIADVMPITDENRLIVASGLNNIKTTCNKGLCALIEEACQDSTISKKRKITSTTVGFVLAPRINACGRMESSQIAVELFMTDSYERATHLAQKLGETNKKRQIIEGEILDKAILKINSQCDPEKDKVLILDDDEWHHGVIGIVSSRITEKYNLPSVLISFKEDGRNKNSDLGKGSARSVKGMNLVSALESCSDLLEKFGGHELAAGLSIKREKLPEFRERMNAYATRSLSLVSQQKSIEIDCEIDACDVSIPLATELSRLEPFGLGNSVPLFSVSDMQITSIIPISDGKHTKIFLKKNNVTHTGLLFGVATKSLRYLVGDNVDVAFNVDVNDFKNQQNVQMIVRDLRPAKCEKDVITQHLYKYSEIVSDNGKVRANDIPARSEFAQIFTTLRGIIESANNDEDRLEIHIPNLVKKSAKLHSAVLPIYKVMIIMDVFSETGIIDVISTHSPLTRIINTKHIPPQKKVNLDDSPTIKRLLSKISD